MIKKTAKKLLKPFGIHNREDMDYKMKQLLGKSYYWTTYPMAVQIDTTNRCGPKHSGIICEYCFPQNEVLCGRDHHADMPMDWIEWIQKDMAKNMPRLLDASWPPKQQVCYFLNGDWQNEMRSEEILANHAKLLPWLPSQVFTCATKPEEAKRFVHPYLTWVCVTLSAPNAEIYKKVYHADKFDNVLKSMRYIDDHSYPHQKLEVHYVITQNNITGMKEWFDLIHKEFPRWRKIFSPLVKSESNEPSVKAMGNLTLEQQEQAIRNVNKYQGFWDHRTTPFHQPCVLWNNAAITVHGDILQCCNWSEPKLWNYGNIQDYIAEGRSLKNYWMERLANKQRNSLCRQCNLKHPESKRRLEAIDFKVNLKI